MNNYDIIILILAIGITTYLTRLIPFYVTQLGSENRYVKRSLEAVPSAMLVALVIPFTFFVNNALKIFRVEVYAILISVVILLFIRKYEYGLVIALVFYFLLSYLL